MRCASAPARADSVAAMIVTGSIAAPAASAE